MAFGWASGISSLLKSWFPVRRLVSLWLATSPTDGPDLLQLLTYTHCNTSGCLFNNVCNIFYLRRPFSVLVSSSSWPPGASTLENFLPGHPLPKISSPPPHPSTLHLPSLRLPCRRPPKTTPISGPRPVFCTYSSVILQSQFVSFPSPSKSALLLLSPLHLQGKGGEK